MARPTSRQGLIDYCLRELGHPVLEVNVDEDQVSDRIDQALQFYQDYHYDAVERLYLATQVTASRIYVTSSVGQSFQTSEKVVGLTSGAYAFTCTENRTSSSGTSILVKGTVGTFVTGETVRGEVSQTTGVLASFSQGVIDKKYLEVSDEVLGVVRVMPFSAVNTGESYMWDVRYQMRLNDMFSLVNTSMIYYYQVKQQLANIDMIMVGSKSFHYQRHQNRVFLDMSWDTDISVGEYIVIECYRALNPEFWNDVYNDRFLKRYATALIKRQWGNNLKKFEGVQMPGGVTLNGQKIFDEAVDEIRYLEDEMRDSYQEPPDFFVG